MIRRLIGLIITGLVVLWLIGWVLHVGPIGAWHDVEGLATRVYGLVHHATRHTTGPLPAPPSAHP